MAVIVTRAGKGAPLSNAECDANFTNLNTDKLEINAALGTPASVTLTNATGLPTAGLVDNAVTNAKLRDSAGLSVIGRGANSTGDPADIVAGTNHQVLRRDGSSLGFGAVDLSSNQAVTGTLPVNQGGTGITSFGSGIAAFLGTPTSANLATAVTDETGSGALVFATNPVIDGATIPARTNPLARAIAVQMTASATVGGIQQLDNDNLDMGTNDFTLEFDEVIPTTRPSADIVLDRKHDGTNGYILTLRTTGIVRLQINATTYDSTVALASATNVNPKLYIPVIRSSASAAGSVTFYTQGAILGVAVAIAVGAPTTVNNASARIINGTTTTRTAGSLQASRLFNRALTAAEVLDYTINGPALSERGASQTDLMQNFEAVIGAGVSISGKTATYTAAANNIAAYTPFILSPRLGRRTRITFQISGRTSGGISFSYGLAAVSPTYNADGIYTVEVINPSNSNGRLYVYSSGTTTLVVEVLRFEQIGIVSELLASNAQSNTGQILDSSGNRNHALLPASGATIVGRPVSQTREVRWTNTWAGTNELQYIGGVNQAILPANAYIESIVGTVSGATPHDIIVGDGSDTDRYVTITTGLAAGTTNFALAARTTDGTNLKLTVDPDTNSDMSIAWVIRYSTLEA